MALMESIRIDFPAPVSPVSTLKPGVKFTSAFFDHSYIFNFQVCQHGPALPVRCYACLAAAGILLQRLADLGRTILGTHEDKERIVAGKRADNPIPLFGVKTLHRRRWPCRRST